MTQVADIPGQMIRVRGRVQGVGMRPLVKRLATRLDLRGSVRNDAEGLLIEAYGTAVSLVQLIELLQHHIPASARIDAIERSDIASVSVPAEFSIVSSGCGNTNTEITPDLATCPDCLAELFNPDDRRYRYPFINCTHCGPRFSIIRAVPYDRVNTSMVTFRMCADCQAEYDDPEHRRYHAQPNACPRCGPQLWLEDGGGCVDRDDDAVSKSASLLRAGYIIAVKGVGGFYLACDARSEAAVARLRERKQRPHKPLALLARNIDMVRCYAAVNNSEAALLSSPEAPIVLLAKTGAMLASSVAPQQTTLGFALPSNPLLHLLMQELDFPIVLTSGNRSEEPQCRDNDEARRCLVGIADYFLLHDRDIINRSDDSVLRVVLDQPRLVRRARGYAPASIKVPDGFDKSLAVLALGGELKNTFCLLHQGRAIVSQHIGDLEQPAAWRDFHHQLALYRRLFDFAPRLIAVDQHPQYQATHLGEELAQASAVACVAVQHHHAHIAAVLTEQGVPLSNPPVLGIVLDGLGMGEDGAFWGGEFLLADYRQAQRLAHFDQIAMPGGMQAIRQPWRNTLAQLLHYFDCGFLQARYPDLECLQDLAARPVTNLETMIRRGINSPAASSAGRLFDAVAALLGVCREQCSYEGQAAIELETLAAKQFHNVYGAYPYELIVTGDMITLNWRKLWLAILDELQNKTAPATIAARFHRTVIDVMLQTTRRLSGSHVFDHVVLTGGVLQNRLILEGSAAVLSQAGFDVLLPARLPANDGALALGQAMVTAANASVCG